MNPALKFSSATLPQDQRTTAQIIESLELRIKDCKTKEEAWDKLIGTDYILGCMAIQNKFNLTKIELFKFVSKIYGIAPWDLKNKT